MTTLYAVPLAVGILLMLAWIGMTAAANTIDGWADRDPERRFGSRVRLGLAFILGFGLAGISAVYAGWADGFTVVAAIGGGLFLGAAAAFLAPTTES